MGKLKEAAWRLEQRDPDTLHGLARYENESLTNPEIQASQYFCYLKLRKDCRE